MPVTPYFQELIINAQVYSFAHLNPFYFDFESKMAKKKIRVNVVFTNHCFTAKHDKSDTNGLPLFPQKKREDRIFCPIRYRLSKDLPTIIRQLNDEKQKVKQTASRRNWGHSITINNPNGPYHVFLDVKKATGENKKNHDIKITIESAYHEDKKPPTFIGRMGFQLLCSKVYLGKPVSTNR